jgi:hypothetical protein
MDPQQQLLDERHTQVIAALLLLQDHVEGIAVRVRTTETQMAVLMDRSSRTNALSWSSLGAVLIGGIYWMLRQ